jgi:hypothetical protein
MARTLCARRPTSTWAEPPVRAHTALVYAVLSSRRSDAERRSQFLAMKFYTEEGNWDLFGNYTLGAALREERQDLVAPLPSISSAELDQGTRKFAVEKQIRKKIRLHVRSERGKTL